jgi:peptidoglycan glycosyltransferase
MAEEPKVAEEPKAVVPKAKRSGPRGCLLLAIVLLVLVAGLFAVSWIPLRNARTAWRAGNNAQAVEEATRWSRMKVWSNQYHQLLAISLLTVGNRPGAQPHLDAIRGGRLWVTIVPKNEVARHLFQRGNYEEFLLYDKAVKEMWERDDVTLYRAAALLATNRVALAEDTLKEAEDADPKQREVLRHGIEQRKQGNFPYVVDRNNDTIAIYRAADDDVVAVNVDFAPLVEREAGALTIESATRRGNAYDTIGTTLDAAVQKAAVNAISGFRGSLVAIDPRTNEILAIASSRGSGPLTNLAVEQRYEPGSVMKVLTGLAALEANVDFTKLFPYQCNGYLPIDGRQFGDWREGGHGALADFDEALAQSCNVVFADLGLRAGRERLQALHKRAGFDSEIDLGLFKAPLGKSVGTLFNNFETGFYAIGLEHESITTLHLAMLASMLANRGELTTPKVFRGRRTILGDELPAKLPQAKSRVATREQAERMIQAMEAVVNRPTGTGRRAKVEGISMALKTGTAGVEQRGYHAAVIGFAPVDQPKIAFALIAEEAGPAEFTAAKMAHDFVSAIRPRL